MSTRLHIVVSDELLARIDAARGEGQPRADWVRRAVEQALGSPGSPDAVAGVRGRVPAPVPAEQPADVDVILGKAAEGLEFNRGPRVRSSAAARPFRQGYGPNVENVRSSSQSKRDVRPVPKKGEK